MSKLPDWNDLRYFLAVARSGGLTPAAAVLRTSASTVSRHIDAMEARLGVRLFLRQQRGYLLTDQGSTLFDHVAEVERAMHTVERRGDGAGEIAGLVKLAASESLANYLIAPHLPAFTCRHPQIRVELVVSRSTADLSRREADLALRLVNPEQRDHNPDYIAHPLGLLGFGLYCAPAALARVSHWRELNYVSWDESWAKVPITEWLRQLFPDREPVLRTNTLHTQYVAARSGLGAIMLPCFAGDAEPALQRLDTAELRTDRELWLLYHRDLKASQRVLAMRDFLQALTRQQLPEMP
jgi:DNA-binding transcriptional LysR family regulator